MRYGLYAWGSPIIVVLLCVLLDHIRKGSVGYGKYTFSDYTIIRLTSLIRSLNIIINKQDKSEF